MTDPIALRTTVFLDGRDVPIRPWDVATSSSSAALARFAGAVVLCRAVVTDSFRVSGDRYPLGRGVSVDWRVFLPEGLEDRFRGLAKPEELRPASRVGVTMTKTCEVSEEVGTILACACGGLLAPRPGVESAAWAVQVERFRGLHRDGAYAVAKLGLERPPSGPGTRVLCAGTCAICGTPRSCAVEPGHEDVCVCESSLEAFPEYLRGRKRAR